MTDLPARTLGRTGLEVTVLGYGAMELRGERPITSAEAATILNAVLSSGINYIDTSIDYGESERLIGEAIADRRDEYFLASKCGCVVGAPPGTRDASGRRESSPHAYDRETIVSGIDQSLRRLKTDYLDLVQLHMSPTRKVLEQESTIETLLDIQRAGKVRFIGSSSVLPDISDHIEMGVFDVFQIPYSALERQHEEAISQAARSGAGTVIRGGVAKGRPGEGRGARKDWNVLEAANLDDLLDGASRAEFMLRYTVSHPDLHTTIVGTMNPDHLAANVAAVKKGVLPADVYEEAERRFAQVGSTPG